MQADLLITKQTIAINLFCSLQMLVQFLEVKRPTHRLITFMEIKSIVFKLFHENYKQER